MTPASADTDNSTPPGVSDGYPGGSATNEPAAGGKVLVVDDEPAIVDAITYNLRQQGFVPIIAGDADTALRLLRSKEPDVVILDVMLPSGSGFDVCRLIRQSGNTVPILMLTARVSESDRVQGLEAGADDYLVKPFGMRELMARIRALLRRSLVNTTSAAGEKEGKDTPTIASTALGLILDPEKREASLHDQPLTLSRKEFDLLLLLASHPGKVFNRQTLLDRVWGEDAYVDDRTIDVHIRWLREKVEPVPGKPKYLITLRGVGYKFQI
ncbi:MAG: response regulator transcription factor [Armatimonadota bacterium]